MQKINDLSELMKAFLAPSKEIVKYETNRLLPVGENYGSLMLLVKVEVRDVSNEKENEILDIVAKLPPSGDFINTAFNIPVTFRNEVLFYKDFIPKIQQFLKESNVGEDYECFPVAYGARLSFNRDQDYADQDAVLLMENLKLSGFVGLNRTDGFDYETSKIILETLAKFHAVPIAYKLTRPEQFKKEIRSLFTTFSVFANTKELKKPVMNALISSVEEYAGGKKYSQRIRNNFEKSHRPGVDALKNSPEFIKEPFSSIIHADLWVNNLMIKFDNDKPSQCKLVDFQLYEYGSPAIDLFFLIFTCVQISVLKNHYEELISIYHDEFARILTLFNCYDDKIFSLSRFHDEIGQAGIQSEIGHVIFMLDPIFATEDNIKELDQLKEDDLYKKTEKSAKYKERLAFLVEFFANKLWI